jgi:4-amino-4-deoxy-L-arabinose transferase-like glycosyltransferase
VLRLRIWLARHWDSHPRTPERRHALRWLAPGFAAFVVLRLPSLIEPHWYTDEASYVSTGQMLLRGHVLYSQIWSNKPPLQLWTVAAVAGVFGPSELALHLLTLVSGLGAVAAVAWAASRVLGVRRAALATFSAGVLLGLPILDAELAIPESLMIAPLSWAGALVVVRLVGPVTSQPSRRARWPIAVGVLVAVAIAYQQTAVAEASAFGLAIALSPRTRWRELTQYVVTVLALTAVWLGAVVSTAGVDSVRFALLGFYVAYTQSVLPASASGSALHFAEAAIAVALVSIGAVFRRTAHGPLWVLLLWLASSLTVAAVAGQPYAHYLTPAVAPAALTVAAMMVPLRSVLPRLRTAESLRWAPQLAGVAVAGVMASVAGLDWIPAASTPALNATRTLQHYYGGAITAALHISDKADWDEQFDSRVGADKAVADWLSNKGLRGASAVVWSSDSWLYSLADLPVLMPTPPIYNDEVLLGNNGPVAKYVEDLDPDVIIVASDAAQQFPEIQTLLQGSKYEVAFQSDPDVVWVRADIVPSLP